MGITFHPDLVNEIRQYYPDKSIEDSLRDNGIDPAMVGYQRIYQLKRKLAGSTFSYSRSHYKGEWIAHLKDHPYVKRANSHQLSLKDCFYQDAQCFNTLPIDEILQIFKIDPNRMPMQWKSAVKSRINRWSGHEQVPICDAKSPLMIEINHQRIQKLTEMIDGYMDEYNHQRYQYSLAGLTPAEFYIYSTTGIYPLDNYFGVTSRELMSVSKLVEARLNKAREKAAKAREAARKKREERALLTSVPGIIARDQRILRREKRKWEESKEIAERQMEKLDKVYEGTKRAIRFYEGCPPEIKESLRNPNNWNQYPELGYVNEIGDLY